MKKILFFLTVSLVVSSCALFKGQTKTTTTNDNLATTGSSQFSGAIDTSKAFLNEYWKFTLPPESAGRTLRETNEPALFDGEVTDLLIAMTELKKQYQELAGSLGAAPDLEKVKALDKLQKQFDALSGKFSGLTSENKELKNVIIEYWRKFDLLNYKKVDSGKRDTSSVIQASKVVSKEKKPISTILVVCIALILVAGLLMFFFKYQKLATQLKAFK